MKMPAQSHLTLVSRQDAVPAARTRQSRYCIDISGFSGPEPLILVSDRLRRRTILEWQGSVARQLLDSHALPLARLRDGRHDCDKALMQRLAMAGAAAISRLSQPEGTRQAASTTGETAGDISTTGNSRVALHGCVERLLAEFPKQHLAEEDIVCLMHFRLPCVSEDQVRTALNDLTNWRRLQRISVPGGSVHYDTDTRPHLHVYDCRTRQLRDAPSHGVLRLT